jgi:hypothetical protein
MDVTLNLQALASDAPVLSESGSPENARLPRETETPKPVRGESPSDRGEDVEKDVVMRKVHGVRMRLHRSPGTKRSVPH